MSNRRLTIWHVMALALAARLLTFVLLPRQDFPDANSFTNSGESLFSTGQMAVDIYMPLYPIWNFMWGGGWGVKFGDILLSTATVALIFYLSLILFRNRPAAMISALMAAVYPHFLFYSVSGLTETSFAFLVVATFVALYRERYLLGSVLLAIGILVRPTLDLFAPLLIILFVVVVHRRGHWFAARNLARYALIYTVVMSPWWLHNYVRYGEFVRLNLGDGIVLFSGNNPLNQTGGGVGYSWEMLDMDVSPFQAITDPIARNEAYKEAARKFIQENPGRFIELAALKFLRFWRLWPYAPQYEQPSIIVVSLLSYGVVLTLTLMFLFKEVPSRWRELSPIFGVALYLTAVHMVTIGSIRYRLPLEPFMLILASYMMVRLIQHNARLQPLISRFIG